MAYLFDTNVFPRLARKNDPERKAAIDALRALREQNEELCYTSQVLAEFWNVSTRPTSARGGLGLSITVTDRKVRMVERHFRFLPDNPAVHQEWRRLIIAHSVQGIQVHDARLVATMNVYGVINLVTFNKDDFKRFSGITVLAPQEIS